MEVPLSCDALCKLLSELGIDFQREDHPPVFTCEQAEEVTLSLTGADTKNLFLTDDKRTRFFLVSVPHSKKVDLKALGKVLGVKGLTMGSPEFLKEFLGVTPGSVTLLGVISDKENRVSVVLDRELAESARILCHPLVNSSTISISMEGLRAFYSYTGHSYSILDVPSKPLPVQTIETRGASMVEAAIGLTLFFTFLGGAISMGLIILTSLLASDILRGSVRTMLVANTPTCITPTPNGYLQSSLATAQGKYSLHFDGATLSASRAPLTATASATTSLGSMLTFTIRAKAPCPLCPFLGLGTKGEYPVTARASMFVPTTEVCSDVP